MKRFCRDEGGQTIVLFAGALPLILVLLLLVIDGGRLYVERERIRNAAQTAAEAAVSLSADQPGRSEASDREIRNIVAEALRRNLPGETYTHRLMVPFDPSLTTFNLKVTVAKEFRASIQAIRFGISAEAAAKLGGTEPDPAQGKRP